VLKPLFQSAGTGHEVPDVRNMIWRVTTGLPSVDYVMVSTPLVPSKSTVKLLPAVMVSAVP
jgi:hypothetical protein